MNKMQKELENVVKRKRVRTGEEVDGGRETMRHQAEGDWRQKWGHKT